MKQVITFFVIIGLVTSQLEILENNDDYLTASTSTDFGDDYLAASAYWTDKVFEEIKKYKCFHGGSPAKSFKEIASKKRINCSTSSSIVFQKAGILSSGVTIGHTTACKKNKDCGTSNYLPYYNVKDFNTALKRSMTGVSNLKDGRCDIVKVMKKHKSLPDWLKKKGIIYVHDSNMCVSAGSKKIWSCNSSGKNYGTGGVDPLRSKGYTFDNEILFAVVPRTHGKTNVDKSSGFAYKSC